ncbi:hypothetical protein QMA56_08980 [Leuconostoc falkenbergense]|uniref:hypothetical protein n=1 Tax=Leuconostoc falkenbergense TaxID=2766470 RepID=UPI0024AD1389|nr:hypothetical protein [Leuconostoc falkenbergense]MDI6667840.1 hypothetical protein [Leuconostoc falkenbergense]
MGRFTRGSLLKTVIASILISGVAYYCQTSVSAAVEPSVVKKVSFRLLTPNSPTPEYELTAHVDGGEFNDDLRTDAYDFLEFGGNFAKPIESTIRAALSNNNQDVDIKFQVEPNKTADATQGMVRIKGSVIETYDSAPQKSFKMSGAVQERHTLLSDQSIVKRYEYSPLLSKYANNKDFLQQGFANIKHAPATFNEQDTYQPGIVYQQGQPSKGDQAADAVTWDRNGKPMVKDSANTIFMALADGLKEAWKNKGTVTGGKLGFAKLLALGGPFGDALDMVFNLLGGSTNDPYTEALGQIKEKISELSTQMDSVADLIKVESTKQQYQTEIREFKGFVTKDLSSPENVAKIHTFYRTMHQLLDNESNVKSLSESGQMQLEAATRGIFSSGQPGEQNILNHPIPDNWGLVNNFAYFGRMLTGEDGKTMDMFKTFATYDSLKYNYNTQTFDERAQFNQSIKALYTYYYLPLYVSIAYDAYSAAAQANESKAMMVQIDDVMNNPKNSRYEKVQADVNDVANLHTLHEKYLAAYNVAQNHIKNDKELLGDYDGAVAGNVDNTTSSTTGSQFDFLANKKMVAKAYGMEMNDPSIDPTYTGTHGHLDAEKANADDGEVFAYRIQKYIKTEKKPEYIVGLAYFANSQYNNDWQQWYLRKENTDLKVHNSDVDLIKNKALKPDEISKLKTSVKIGKTLNGELASAGIQTDGYIYAGKCINKSDPYSGAAYPTYTANVQRINANGEMEEHKAFNENHHCIGHTDDIVYDQTQLAILVEAPSQKVNYKPYYNY